MDFEVTAMKTTYDANILTYCQWRDDLTMQQSPFCHVDNLIFCCLSYLNWDGIAEGFTAAESISLRDAARLWEHRPTAEQKVRVETDRDLLRQTAASRRFGEVRLFRYAEQFSETQQQQFSATAFLLDSDTVYVAFRGTDNTLTGWREDFNLSFLPYVPSQAAAAAYLRGILSLGFSNVYVGGHSKGGNLALYAALRAKPAVQERIERVYTHDGPGFKAGTVDAAEYAAIRDRVHKTVPQDSLVGMLMDAPANLDLHVVHSSDRGIQQHSVFTWDVEGDDFAYVDGLTDGARFTDAVITHWLAGFSDEEAAMVVDALFQALEASGAQNATEVLSGGAKSISLLSEAAKNIDPGARDVLLDALGSLAEVAAREAAQGLMQRFAQKSKSAV